MAARSYTAILEKDGDLYVALCPELDVASQGATVEEAIANLKEAVELFLESADPNEVTRRLHSEVFVTRFDAGHGSELKIGALLSIIRQSGGPRTEFES